MVRPLRTLTPALAALTLATGLLTVTPAGAADEADTTQGAAASSSVRATVRTFALDSVDAGGLVTSPSASTPVPVAGEDHAEEDSRGHVGAASASLRPAASTPAIATKPFGLIGLTASEPFDPASRIVMRIRQDGEWQPWMQVPISDHLPDPDTEEGQRARYASEPVAMDQADGVQVRVDTPTGAMPADAQVTMIDNPERPEDADLEGQTVASPTARNGVSKPKIITRAEWGADESLRRGTTQYSDTIKVAWVHHVVSSNDYTAAQAAQQMRNVYSWFTEGIQVNDFGYNFMVDRFGRLYEGRAGGVDKAVIGAHTSGFNSETFAVSFLGNADTLDPKQSAKEKILDSISDLIAWKFDLFDVNPLGKATLTSAGPGPGQGTTSMYWPGEKVSIETIAGHGDIGSTSCPGEFLRPTMPHLRLAVSARQGRNFYPPSIKGNNTPWGEGGSILLNPKSNGAMDATLTVSNACGEPVRTMKASTDTAATLNFAWDQRDDKGKQMPPGLYTFRIDATSNGKDLFPWEGTARISATADSPPDPCTPPEQFTIAGTGYGHGVGLSQWGAMAMAERGWNAERIVQYYYPGTKVKSLDDESDVRISLLYQKPVARARVENLSGSGSSIEITLGKRKTVVVDAGVSLTFKNEKKYVSVRQTVNGKTSKVGRARTVTLRWSGTRDPGAAGSAPSVLNVAGPDENYVSEGHRYRYGHVEIAPVTSSDGRRLAVVNVLRLGDEYLRGIAEVVPTWPQEALRSQVIASRAYALSKLAAGVRKDCLCHMDDGDGPYYDQTFKGYTVESGYGGDNWVKAVEATRSGSQGEVVTYQGAPIPAFYTAATGGMTNSAQEVWGGSGYPWATPVDDHWSLDAPGNPYRRWNVVISQARAEELFGITDVMTIEVSKTMASGAAKEVTARSLDGRRSSLSASSVRSALSMRSTYITGITEQDVAGDVPIPTGGVSLRANPKGDVKDGTLVTLSGQIKNPTTGLVVQRQVQVNGGEWQDRNSVVATADGRFALSVMVTGVGNTYTWRVLVMDGGVVIARSGTRKSTVY